MKNYKTTHKFLITNKHTLHKIMLDWEKEQKIPFDFSVTLITLVGEIIIFIWETDISFFKVRAVK